MGQFQIQAQVCIASEDTHDKAIASTVCSIMIHLECLRSWLKRNTQPEMGRCESLSSWSTSTWADRCLLISPSSLDSWGPATGKQRIFIIVKKPPELLVRFLFVSTCSCAAEIDSALPPNRRPLARLARLGRHGCTGTSTLDCAPKIPTGLHLRYYFNPTYNITNCQPRLFGLKVIEGTFKVGRSFHVDGKSRDRLTLQTTFTSVWYEEKMIFGTPARIW